MTDIDTSTLWHVAAQSYLARLGAAEYAAQRAKHGKRSPKTFRFSPSQYMRELIDCMNRNDEQAFKARKMLEGYSTVIGV